MQDACVPILQAGDVSVGMGLSIVGGGGRGGRLCELGREGVHGCEELGLGWDRR